MQYTNDLVNYDIYLLEKNHRNLANDPQTKTNQDAIDVDAQQIQDNQTLVATLDQLIKDENYLLPITKNIQPAISVDQQSCVKGYPCTQPSWQQPFIDGWQYVTGQPLSTTWSFWLRLLLALAGIFFLLPFIIDRSATTYRILSYGPLMDLNDAEFPAQKRETLAGDTSLLKIEIRSQLVVLKKKDPLCQVF